MPKIINKKRPKNRQKKDIINNINKIKITKITYQHIINIHVNKMLLIM